MSSKEVEAAQIYVPALAEQTRILGKLTELIRLCDRLETQIAAGETASSRLLDALLHEALASPSREFADHPAGC